MAKYFVTGATGFIGGRVTRQLVDAGHDVVAIARNPESARDLESIGVDVRRGDITNPDSLRGPMAGVDGVFHIAGWYKIGSKDPSEGERINVAGTRNVLSAMKELRVPKGVYTSTLAVFSDTHGQLVDDTYRHRSPWLTEYDRTKWIAHYEIAEPMIRAGLPLVVVQPGVNYGPGDTSEIRPTFVRYLQGKLRAIPKRTAYCWAHVEDTARAHVLAMERGRVGETYIIAGPPHTLIEAFDLAARITGIPAPRFHALPAQFSGGDDMPRNEGQSTLFFGPWYRKSPFFEATQRAGAKAYDIYNHMYLPGLYTDPFEEYWHLINHVTLWDVSVERQVEISGRDGAKFAELITPRDLTKCNVGQGKYVVITDENGRIINDPVLIRLEKNRFWLSLANSDTLLWAKGLAVNSGMDVDISEPDVSPLQVQGPDSKNVLKDLVGPAILDLGYYYFMNTKIAGIPVVLTRTGWTAEVGYEVYLTDGRRGLELWDRIMEAGKKYDIRPIAPSEIRRIEGGILNYGSDMTLENNPYEVGLGWLVDLNKKADFVGKKALVKIKEEGVKRKLVGVEIQGPQIHAWATEFWDVKKDGKKVGHLTALTYSPRLEKNIAYAWVPIRLTKLGTRLTIATSAGERDATVVKKPFVDPKKSIPKS